MTRTATDLNAQDARMLMSAYDGAKDRNPNRAAPLYGEVSRMLDRLDERRPLLPSERDSLGLLGSRLRSIT